MTHIVVQLGAALVCNLHFCVTMQLFLISCMTDIELVSVNLIVENRHVGKKTEEEWEGGREILKIDGLYILI